MEKSKLLPVVVALLTVGLVGALTVYRNTCNVVDPGDIHKGLALLDQRQLWHGHRGDAGRRHRPSSSGSRNEQSD